MKSIAFLTSSNFPKLTPSDKLVADYLESHGFHTELVIWDDPNLKLETYELYLVRSVWDYHKRYEEWMAFLDKLEQHNCMVQNPISVLRWNSNKSYLQNFLNKTNQLPLRILKKGSNWDLAAYMEKEKWEKAVIKPVISASGYKTWTCKREDAATRQGELDSLLSERDLILQEFSPEVVTEGEWSLVFFNKVFSHAVLKRAKKGDFRVQSDYGGTVDLLEAPPNSIEQAQEILNGIEEAICYARVDGIIRDGNFYLMELELVEPELFVANFPGSEKRFGDAILQVLKTT
ncbi:MAG: hypothetical protein R8P61_34960 [Bacteroidia bacterium]|nr:hypothetical protein [Bacteroidia bacterium]